MEILKHSKYKNIGLIYELLTRALSSEVIHEDKLDSIRSIKILKKFFFENSILKKELLLVKSLIDEKFADKKTAEKFVNLVTATYKKFNSKKLTEQKYKLVGTIAKYYDVNQFFKTEIPNFKLYSSIYKILEYQETNNPADYLRSKDVIVEHIISKLPTIEKDEIKERINSLPKDIRLIAYRKLINKFNSANKTLNENQKLLLKKFIENDKDSFKKYIKEQFSTVKNNLKIMTALNLSQQVKMQKVYDLFEKKLNKNDNLQVDDKDLYVMMKLYEIY